MIMNPYQHAILESDYITTIRKENVIGPLLGSSCSGVILLIAKKKEKDAAMKELNHITTMQKTNAIGPILGSVCSGATLVIARRRS